MDRILVTLVKIMIHIRFEIPLTKEDEAIVNRYAVDGVVDIVKQLEELADTIYKRRLKDRHDTKEYLPLHPGYGSERKLQRGEGDDGLDDNERSN